MERLFIRSVRYVSRGARWKGLWRVRIQEYLIAAIQNIQILMRYGNDPRREVSKVRDSLDEKLLRLSESSKRFLLEFIFRLKAEAKVNFVFSDR